MSDHEPLAPESFVRLPDVIRHTGMSRSTIYRRISDGAFPAPYSLGPRASGWRWGELVEWLKTRASKASCAPRGAA